jgi:hypothetical protein
MGKRNFAISLFVLIFLFLISIACQQSGEIISPAEATQRYESTQAAEAGDFVEILEGATYPVGSAVELTEQGLLVALYKDPSDNNPFSFATRGDQVEVVGSMEYEGEIWYKVTSPAGDGWLPETNLLPVE